MMTKVLLLVLAMAATAQAGESKDYKAEKKAGKDRVYQICGFSAPRVPGQVLIAIARTDVATLRDGPTCATLDQMRLVNNLCRFVEESVISGKPGESKIAATIG